MLFNVICTILTLYSGVNAYITDSTPNRIFHTVWGLVWITFLIKDYKDSRISKESKQVKE
jgi:hypothetical protein